ncbi:MAG: hypothetical protein ACTHJL_08920 [Amnibacterium sp.]
MPEPDTDDDALRWAGDEQEPARPARPVRAATVAPVEAERAGAATLLTLGVLGGVAVLETLGWVRSVLSVTMESTLEPGSGAFAAIGFGINVLGRIAAVAAPLLWFLLAATRIHQRARRLAWLLLGAVLLLPWPALLGLL